MDPFSTVIGMSILASPRPKSLIEWNAQYEALSVRNDWWFKAGAALAVWVRSTVEFIADAIAPARQPARA